MGLQWIEVNLGYKQEEVNYYEANICLRICNIETIDVQQGPFPSSCYHGLTSQASDILKGKP